LILFGYWCFEFLIMSNNIRNFCILAHVDHGKSTLADRFLELTGTIATDKLKPQFLDSNPISRERGITIKLAPVRMTYQCHPEFILGSKKMLKQVQHDESTEYILNLIDTPGHIDFSYEVSRSLAACEGAILVVDATQGIQAQTASYFQKASEQGLTIIPVVNKIDLPGAQPEQTASQLVKAFGFTKEEILFISAKTGAGIPKLLQKLIAKIPPPINSSGQPLRALVFDSFYDTHKGVVVAIKIVDGEIKNYELLQFAASQTIFTPLEIGYFTPSPKTGVKIENGAVGYVATGLKNIELARVGDTILTAKSIVQPLTGYQPPQPMVYAGVYPINQDNYQNLVISLEKLKLNDASLSFQPENSLALGKGLRIGFLGPLHAEVVLERLEREFGLELVATAPNVEYKIKVKGQKLALSEGEGLKIKNLSDIPASYDEILEPVMLGNIFTPQQYLGQIMKLCQQKRGKLEKMDYIGQQIKLEYQLPLAEIIVDFFPQLKSVSSGFASFDYQFLGYFPFNGVKIDILVGGQKVDALSIIVPKNEAYRRGKNLVEKLSQAIPKQMFEFAIQAAVAGKIIARATKKAWRKDVTAKLYGGDRTRKDKLLEKQKRGKKKMKAVGRIFIPQEAFLEILKRD
jgi:GTP-binding protein LepA